MSDQLSMFDPTTSEGTPSAISSPESASGVTPLGSPDGPTTAKSGLAPAPASPSARPAKAKRSTTKGIFGQSGFLSSKHDDLSFALASRLRPLTDSLGSTLFSLTWTVRITPAGRSICALRASEPPTEGSVCIGWPTPQMSDVTGGGQAKRSDGRANLNDFAMLAGWPTTRAEDAESSGMRHSRGVADTMTAVPTLAGWGTPKPRDYRSENESSLTREGHPPDLNKMVLLAGWTTPQAHDETGRSKGQKEIHGTQHGCACLVNEARLTAFGDQPIGFLLGRNGWETVPASGQLNAAHSRWLMGLPPVWDACGVTAMGSSRKRR
jgi:hypothetical protein